MQNFIVLGLIPGTSVEISFAAWLITTISGAVAYVTWRYHRRIYEGRKLFVAIALAVNVFQHSLA